MSTVPSIYLSPVEPCSGPTLRLCILKREEGESFSFHLRMERGCLGHVIRHVTPWGVAERGGLRDGDRLLEVNEGFVDNMTHPKVAMRIKLSGRQLCLLVLDGEEYDQAMSQGHDLQALAREHRGEGCSPPRLCHIIRDTSSGFGINFLPVEGEKGLISVSLVSGGPAERAGVCQGDRLLWIDGNTVSELTNSVLSKMVKKCRDHMTILVIDSESEQSYAHRRMPILPTLAGSHHNLPHTPRKLQLVPGPEGYGFLLREERTPSGCKAHVMREVDQGSPAEMAGIEEGDLLLEVNGEAVESLGHEDIVDRVRKSCQQVTLTTITARGQEFYSTLFYSIQLDLSPLLFCGSNAVEQVKETENLAPPPLPVVVEVPKEEPVVLPTVPSPVPSPRLCVLQKGPLGFGINLGCVQDTPGTFVSQVALGGSGSRAGLQVGDVVMEVNGQNMEENCLEDVMVLVQEEGHSLSLLVVEKSGYNKLGQSQSPFTAVETTVEEETDGISAL
ncbi:NHERF family PDZ scaffold protein 4b [Salmo salar]|uniref:NHERF family PDZ scaffold protein 4b n=1 Tax=Salmo salar TaxID=8030 RepID=A0ABM3EMB0_SALSA|nr:PDZ domain containing 3b [Salmo salar]